MNSGQKTIKETVKKHIPQRHLASLRILHRIGMETIFGIKRTGLMNIAIAAAMAAILTIFGSLLRTSLSLSSFVAQLGSAFEISAYLKPNIDPVYTASIIKEIPHVKKIEIVPKEKAWEEMSGEMDVSGLENPLPDTLHITVDNPDNISEVCDNIQNISGIEDMSYAQKIAEKLQTLTNVFNTVTLFVLVTAAVLTIIIINSTIQLVIQSRKEEIEIMRLMGVSSWYIKLPLILQGAIYGFIGALIALIPLNILDSWLIKLHTFLMAAQSEHSLNIAVFCIFIMAVFFSAGGSIISIKKHLQV